MNQQELEKYLWGAATALRGTIDAGDYKQYIFPLLFFKRISDVYDEEFETALAESDGDIEFATFAENHHFIMPEGSHWNDVRETTVNVGLALQDTMRAIEQANPDTLYGIFGDASWTNKDRLSDEILTNLIEHFSQHTLSLSNVPDDQLGNAYEYLIKEFADDSGHTAAEFYTNRTVVKLMTMIMDPQPGESVYDPTCGSGGLLLNCALHLKDEGKEYRSLKLYGQEINLLTSAIARMNMFMHGIEEFDIIRGNTLSNPGLLENDQLKTFNVILANPPYSIKSWDRKSFESDPYGRNIWGTPPQGCADYAFQQHMQKSLDKDNGRCISLWPHGILFRDAEADMRRQMIEEDLVECVIGLGPNLFYNSPMEACLLITRTNKPEHKKGKILFINAVKEVKQEKNMGYLEQHHIDKIFSSYQAFESQQDFSELVSNEEVLEKKGNMAINLYIRPGSLKNDNETSLPDAFKQWQDSSLQLTQSMQHLFEELSQTIKPQSLKSAKKGGGVFFDELDIENFSIDKSDWEKVNLGDVVFEPKESTKDPIADGIKHVVGLEHIDSEDINLRRSADFESGSTTFTKKFAKGDVLFGRRRAYLKKAAKADFEGICSGDITVMRAKEGLLPELLPFLINNDKFFDYAVQHSAGGLSPRVKFKDLANYDLWLPPLKLQREILEFLNVSKNLDVSNKQVLNFINQLYKSFLKKLETSIEGSKNAIGDYIEIKNGFAFSGKYISDEETDLILMTPGNFKIGGGFLYKKIKYFNSEIFDKRFVFNKGDLVITMTDLSKAGDTLGSPAIIPTIEGKKILHNQRLGRVDFINKEISLEFLFLILQTQSYRIHILKASTRTTVSHTYPDRIKKYKFNCPSEKEQKLWVNTLGAIREAKTMVNKHSMYTLGLHKELIGQVF